MALIRLTKPQWVRNERIINRHPGLRAARDVSEGFTPTSRISGGKGDSRRPGDLQAYRDNYDRIFRKNNDDS